MNSLADRRRGSRHCLGESRPNTLEIVCRKPLTGQPLGFGYLCARSAAEEGLVWVLEVALLEY